MHIDLTSPPLPESLPLSAGLDWASDCAGEVRARADVDLALASLLDGEVAKLDGGSAANAPLIRALVSALVEQQLLKVAATDSRLVLVRRRFLLGQSVCIGSSHRAATACGDEAPEAAVRRAHRGVDARRVGGAARTLAMF